MSRLVVMTGLHEEVKKVLINLHERVNDSEDCIDLLQTAFLYNAKQPLSECRSKLAGIIDAGRKVAEEIEKHAGERPALIPYKGVPDHVLKIADNIRNLTEQVGKKIEEGVLFSDKAVDEVTFLLQRLIDILRPTADIILARNQILSSYVHESEGDIQRKALEYATLHEERLIEGVCQPIASSVFLSMLESVKSIAWSAREIAVMLMA